MTQPGGLHVIVCGRVQGVGFRRFVERLALQLDVAGWVANLPDGSVEVVADGPSGSIQRLLAALREGPPGAVVRELRTPTEPPRAPADRPFRVRRS